MKALASEYQTVRTGRASTGLLDRVTVDAYGTRTPLNQLATINAPEARLLTVQPYDRSIMSAIEKAIMESDLGLTPNNDGQLIRLPVPQLTEERRKEMVRLVHKMAEEARVAVRNVRRDVINDMKRAEKDGEMSRDELAAGPGRGPEADRRRGQVHRRPDGPQRGRDPRGLSRGDDPHPAAHRPVRPGARARERARAAPRRPHRDPGLGGDHHGRQRALGARPPPAGRGGAPRRRAGAEAGRAGRGRRRHQGPDGLLVLHRELVAAAGRGRGPDGPLLRADRPRGAGARRRAGADPLHRALRRPRRPAAGQDRRGRGADRGQRAPAPVHRHELRRAPGDPRRGAALRGGVRPRGGRGGVRALPLRPRPARPRAGHPDQRRAAPLELPALAVGLRRALLLAAALAGLHARGPRAWRWRTTPRRHRRFGGR